MTITAPTPADGPVEAPLAAPSDALPRSLDEAVERAREVRASIAELGAMIDAEGRDPADALAIASEARLMAVTVPVELGGLWQGEQFASWDRVVEVALEIAAGDGSTGQCWATTAIQAREIFASSVPPSTKDALAGELLHEGRRIVASNAETGGRGPVRAERVDGGAVVHGVKTFNTNSGAGGRDLANVGLAMVNEVGETTRHHVMVRLDAPGVTLHGDWDNMGQRGTVSQTITYDGVFVPDGWFYEDEPTDLSMLAVILSGHGLLMQGIGEGAYDAMLDYLRTLNRPSMPMFESAADDVLMHRQIGEIAARLSASRAYLLQASRRLADADGSTDLGDVLVDMVKVKVACAEAALDASSRLHDLTGARSTANRFRLDRFWRNARTFGSHDSIDAKNALVGFYELNQELPDASRYLPGVRKL